MRGKGRGLIKKWLKSALMRFKQAMGSGAWQELSWKRATLARFALGKMTGVAS
jgi:anaerobic selenocysteine-containing dehydrogenase